MVTTGTTQHGVALVGDPVRKEALAAAALYPGHLCEFPTTAGNCQKHGTLGGNAYPMFALEDDLQGNDVDTAYTINNRVQLGIFRPGDEVYAWIKDGETAVVGSFLESAGDGSLQVLDADTSVGLVKTNSIVAVALEAVSPSGANGRIRVMVV